MRKKILSLILVSSLAIGAMAENATLDFTYAQGELQGYGKGKKEDVDVAICISDPSFAGKKITGIRAYINPSSGISNSSVWLSKQLTITNKVNVPDILSVSVAPTTVKVGFKNYNVLEAKLDQPYEITAEPVYVGYSFTVDDNSTDEQKYPILLSEGVDPNGFFLHLSKSVLKWANYSQTAGGVAYIVAELEGEFPAYCASFAGSTPSYADPGQDFQGMFEISNIGINPINSIKYTYTVDGGPATEGNVNLEDAVQPNLAIPTPVSLKFNGISTVGAHTVNVTITEINGQPNESAKASIEHKVNVIPFRPTRRPLVEEYTGLWCGNCPRGYVAMEYIHENYADEAVVICYHNDDPMMVTKSYPMNVSGFPQASMDRVAIIDPYWGSYLSSYEMTILRDLQQHMDVLTLADINVSADIQGSTINVKSDVSFIQDIEKANYQIGYILLCNELSDPAWAQANYYRGASEWANTPLAPFIDAPGDVEGLVYNDVAIDVSGMNGIVDSLPEKISVGQNYIHNYSFDISNNALVNDVKNLVVTTFIIDKNTKQIVNANKCSLDPSGIDSVIGEDVNVVAKEYYDLSGRKVTQPGEGVFIQVEKLSNGKTKATKIFVK